MLLPESLKSRFNSSPVQPFGSDSSEIYLLVDAPNHKNLRENSPISSDILVPLLDKLQKENLFSDQEDFFSKIRVSNALGYLPINESISKFGSREVEDQDISDLRDYTLIDIEETEPKVIIVSGSVATKLITNFEFESYKEAEEAPTFYYKGIPVIFTGSIRNLFSSSQGTYVRKELNKLCGKFLQAKNLTKGIDPTDVFKNLKWETLDAFNPDEVNKLFDIFTGHSKLILDYEASGLNTYRDGFHLGGIGLCTLDGSISVYVYFYDFFRSYSEVNKPPEETYEILNQFFSVKDFVVFNKQYECAVTISPAVGINYNLKNCEDILMWLRCLSASSSLKEACVNRLGVEKWNDAVEDWVDCINEIVKLEKPTATMKSQRKEIEYMMEYCNGFFDIEEYFVSEFNSEVLKEIKRISTGKPKILKNIGGIKSDYQDIIDFAKTNKTRLKSKKEKDSLLEELDNLNLPETFKYKKGKKFFLKKKDQTLLKIVNKLKNTCSKYFSKVELEEISKKLKYYVYHLLENHEVFEYASFADVPLQIMAPYCIADCNFTAKLYHNVKEELQTKDLIKAANAYDKQAYLGYILTRNGIAWDDKLATELKEEYSKTRIETLRSLITLPSMAKILNLNASTLLNAKSTTNIEVLKDIFNPNSSYKYTGKDEHKTTSIRMSKLIGTPRFKLASLLYDTFEFSKQVDSELECIRQFPTLWPIFNTISKKETAEHKVQYLEWLLENAKEELHEPLIKNQRLYQSKNNGKSPQEVLTRLKYKDWKLESMAHEYTERLYLIFEEIFGIDPNDDTTWPEEFQALYYYKVYKKVEKSIGTYINGAVGRGSVEIVNKEDVEKESPLRVCGYFDRPKSSEEVYINRTSWGVNTADTGRWQAAQHTVPKSTELMDLRSTRYTDGIKLHYDYSQAEVRVLAKLSNDDNLLNAFKSGLDIHCYSGDTEVLTPEGWVRFDNLQKSHQVMQYDPRTTELSFTSCKKIHKRTQEDAFLFDKTNQLVTSNHRILTIDSRTNKVKETLAKDSLPKGGSSRFITGGVFTEEYLLNKTETQLLVAIHDDGYISKKGSVIFGFKKIKKINRLLTLLNKVQLNHSFYYRKQRKEFQITIFKSLSLTKILEVLGPNKTIPWRGLCPDTVLKELQYWDGHSHDNGVTYDSTDKQTVENLHTLFTLGGFKNSPVKTYNKNTSYGFCTVHRLRTHFTRKPYMSTLNETKQKVVLSESYCVQVPTSWILTKRNGVTIVSGNCYNAAMMWNKPAELVTGTERSMAKGVTFSLLYGTSISEFANKYTKRNLSEAKQIIANFFKSYPDVEKFIKKMHKQGALYDIVPTIFGNPIYVNMPNWVKSLEEYDIMRLVNNPYDSNVIIPIGKSFDEEAERKERAKFSKALRNSQNYCIQGTSSHLAAVAMAEFQSYIEKEDLSVKIECFTHDSCDADLRIPDLRRTLEILPEASVGFLESEYGIPMKLDYAIGVSNNKMVELSEAKVEGNRITANFEAQEESLYLLKDKLETYGGVVEFEVHESKDQIISIKDLFVTTNAYAKAMGTPFKMLEGQIEIVI